MKPEKNRYVVHMTSFYLLALILNKLTQCFRNTTVINFFQRTINYFISSNEILRLLVLIVTLRSFSIVSKLYKRYFGCSQLYKLEVYYDSFYKLAYFTYCIQPKFFSFLNVYFISIDFEIFCLCLFLQFLPTCDTCIYIYTHCI